MSKQLLIQAVEALAKEIGATTTQLVTDYSGNRIQVDIALHSSCLNANDGYSMNKGIGFVVDEKGNLVVKGDGYGFRGEYNRVQSLATNYVKAYKIAAAARNNPLSRIRNMNIRPVGRNVVMEVAYV